MASLDFDDLSRMSDLPEQALSPRRYQRGEVVEGEVVRVDDEGIVVSVGLKMEGVVPPQEMRSLSPEERAQLQPGDRLLVAVAGGRGAEGMALLSVDQAREERTWRDLEQRRQDGETVTARVTGHNRGGLVVDCEGIRGFVPFSQMAPVAEQEKQQVLAARVGEQATFHVLEVDPAQERLVLTERAIWQQRREEARQRFIGALEEGAVLTGRVNSVRGFGAFVNLGDAEGLIPFSELSWANIKAPGDVVRVGDEVKVQVLKVDPAEGRITLSLKRTMPEPWETVPERYSVGQIVEGTVRSFAQFGVFVNLEDGVDGLVHISELSARRVNNPRECVYPGQKVRVKVLSIDAQQRRISLSYRQAFGL